MAINCKTPGLRIEWHPFKQNLYATLLHTPTGAIIRKFNNNVILGGKRRFAARVDAALSSTDWLRPVDDLAADPKAKNAAYGIPYDCRDTP